MGGWKGGEGTNAHSLTTHPPTCLPTGILFVEILGPAPGFPSTKSQMDAFWTVYAEKPTLIGTLPTH